MIKLTSLLGLSFNSLIDQLWYYLGSRNGFVFYTNFALDGRDCAFPRRARDKSIGLWQLFEDEDTFKRLFLSVSSPARTCIRVPRYRAGKSNWCVWSIVSPVHCQLPHQSQTVDCHSYPLLALSCRIAVSAITYIYIYPTRFIDLGTNMYT